MEDLLTREELATRLGVSAAEIRRREALGQIRPSKRRGQTPLYKENLVQRLAPLMSKVPLTKERQNYRKLYRYTAEDANRVYLMLREKKPLDQIVTELVLHPGVVQAITEEFVEMTGGIFISGPVMDRINELALDGNFPLVTDEDLLEVLTTCAESTCSQCHKRPRSICKGCVPEVADAMET